MTRDMQQHIQPYLQPMGSHHPLVSQSIYIYTEFIEGSNYVPPSELELMPFEINPQL